MFAVWPGFTPPGGLRIMRTAVLAMAVVAAAPAWGALPASWEGQLVVEQDIPSFSPATGARVTATTRAEIAITASLLGIEGEGSNPYRSDFSAAGCSGESVGEWRIRVRGQRVTPLESVVGTALQLQVSRSGSVTHKINCPGARGPPPRTQTIPATTSQVRLPLADEATFTQTLDIGTGKLNNRVTLRLPCPWDSRMPPGPRILFSPDPRRDALYSGDFDGSQTGKQLTQTKIAQYVGGDVPPSLRDLDSVRGATEVPRWFQVTKADETFSRTVKIGSGACTWIQEIDFSLPPLKQYVADAIWQAGETSQCRRLVMDHERRHREVAVKLLGQAAARLERDLMQVNGEFDAALSDDPLKTAEELKIAAADRIAAVERWYRAESDRRHSSIDDQASAPEAELRKQCRAEGL
jgi:hypothetical protein